ncbi:MAG: phytanoyl-CoA dioxygenase family protein [Acidimicrobiales bacterium]
MVDYDDELGWVRVDGVISPAAAASIVVSCEAALESIDRDPRVGDKPHAGTKRLVDVIERVPETSHIPSILAPVLGRIIEDDYELVEGTYRCPQPGFGQQRLHADDVPRLSGRTNLVATAIIPLVDFTGENGSTRLIPGSNRRPDLQRQSGTLVSHPDEVRLIGPAGSGFVFCGHVLHSGTENRSTRPRPALQFVFRTTRPGDGR